MRQSQYLLEPHGRWLCRPGTDIIVASDDADALRQARQRCTSGAVSRYSLRADPFLLPWKLVRWNLLYVANFFEWEQR